MNYTQSLEAFQADNDLYYKFFDAWAGYSLICPNFKEEIEMKGTE